MGVVSQLGTRRHTGTRSDSNPRGGGANVLSAGDAGREAERRRRAAAGVKVRVKQKEISDFCANGLLACPSEPSDRLLGNTALISPRATAISLLHAMRAASRGSSPQRPPASPSPSRRRCRVDGRRAVSEQRAGGRAAGQTGAVTDDVGLEKPAAPEPAARTAAGHARALNEKLARTLRRRVGAGDAHNSITPGLLFLARP
ncbi:hypothetical protein P154DRAFT_573546 [Amniculicola lignicola CBS 123094]|uniref:Uncharacterized protein n=1 Tax=Amniculicola lignicola CBS 123094 TaxID=1392246 RepID=A0A6A5WNN2_9PLEO|nr:hypothetical protein P154DRAFT_573546 [Amniculicola lignicola CBS 123094]